MDRVERALRPPRLRPTGQDAGDRLLRWCVRRTERDGRSAALRGQPISPRNLRRLLERRLANGGREKK